MNVMFSYFDGSLQDFLAYINENKDNRLVKIRLAKVESFHHVLDNFAVNRRELAGVTYYKRKKKLTDAKSPIDSADSGFASFSDEAHRRK